MRPGWRVRLARWVCDHWRHRPVWSENSGIYWCRRCMLALGPTVGGEMRPTDTAEGKDG